MCKVEALIKMLGNCKIIKVVSSAIDLDQAVPLGTAWSKSILLVNAPDVNLYGFRVIAQSQEV